MIALFRRNPIWQEIVEGRSGYPVFRYELLYWDRRLGGRWRLEEALAWLTLGNLAFLPIALVLFPSLLMLFIVVDEATGFFFSFPAATLIVRERERATLGILRTTPLSGLEIGVGKLVGLLYTVWESLAYVVGARWLGTLLALPLLALMLTVRNPYPLAHGQPAGMVIGGLAAAYLAFIYQPQLTMLYNGALGLAVSTLARSTVEAVMLMLAPTTLLLLGLAALVGWYHYAHGLSGLFSESVLATQLEHIFIWLIPVGWMTLGRLLIAGVCLGLAAHRIDRLVEEQAA